MATPRICFVAGCDKPLEARGLCSQHYHRMHRYGSFEPKDRPIKLCAVPGCGGKHRALGYCSKHAHRFSKYGDPMGGRAEIGAALRWINDHQNFVGADCLIWPFKSRSSGYGVVHLEGSQQIASRVMCELVHGAPPAPRFEAAHSCGNGHLGCMNPNHLKWSTPSENQMDRVAHGTSNRGTRHGASILDEGLVREIRRLKPGRTAKEVSAIVGVSPNNIYHIVNGQRWAWVE